MSNLCPTSKFGRATLIIMALMTIGGAIGGYFLADLYLPPSKDDPEHHRRLGAFIGAMAAIITGGITLAIIKWCIDKIEENRRAAQDDNFLSSLYQTPGGSFRVSDPPTHPSTNALAFSAVDRSPLLPLNDRDASTP